MNDTIQIIYGLRYTKDKRIQLENILKKYNGFKYLSPIKSKVPNNFPKIFETKSIVDTKYKFLFSLKK